MSERKVLILTGMSGAGRSTVAHALEDSGWYVVDNLPPALLPDLLTKSESVPALAVVVDVRGGKFFDDLNSALETLKSKSLSYQLLFLDASDQALVQRFEATRRPHPLQKDDRILDGILRERTKLENLRASADVVIDSSGLNVHQLEKRVAETFGGGSNPSIRINVLSFGYKYGIPVDADLVLDCRFIPNPHWVPELRQLTGLTADVANYVFDQPEVTEVVDKYVGLLKTLSKGYLREGKKFVTLAVGCTGGKHRSVAIAEKIATELNKTEISTKAIHRDLGRE
jgi:UPF0042 nucleotide-binding protein